MLSWRAIINMFSAPRYWADIFTQMDSIGVGSLPIMVLTGFFTGCVLALQSATSLQEFGAVSMTGNLVALSMVKELGPVLTGLMVSGRNASGMASELGSMKVTEQIDAMRALGTDPDTQAGYSAAVCDGVHAVFSHDHGGCRWVLLAARWSALGCWG